MSVLLSSVRRFCREHRLILPDSTVLAACSGGVDSVTLLDVLAGMADEFSFQLHVAHFNHRLRAEESDEDARFVKRLAESYGFPCTVGEWDNLVVDGPVSEARSREARYRFLSETALAAGAIRVALGHTADDQVETVILNLVRGAGLKGLRGMIPLRDSCIRPLLEISRSDLMVYLHTRGLEFRQDSTNAEPVWRRNKLRLDVLPLLTSMNPRLAEDIGRMCRVLKDEDSVMDRLADKTVTEIGFGPGQPLSRQSLLDLHPGIRRRVLFKALKRVAGNGKEIGSKHVEAVMSVLGSERDNARVMLPSGVVFIREYETVLLSVDVPVNGPLPEMQALPAVGEVAFGEWVFKTDTVVGSGPIGKMLKDTGDSPDIELFDETSLTGALQVRIATNGERLCPLGFVGRRKVADILREARVAPFRRPTWPVISDGEGILWVAGCRRSGRASVCGQTEQAVVVSVLKRPRYQKDL